MKIQSISVYQFDYTLPAALYSDLSANPRFGLVSDADNWSRFSSFRVEALP